MKATIETHDGRLRLRWRYQGKRYTLGCGVDATPTGMALAKIKKAEIERDLINGYFDPSLLKYRTQVLGKNATHVSAPELFRKFTQAMQRDKGLESGSLCRYQGCLSHLVKSLDIPANRVADRVAGDLQPGYLRQSLTALPKSTCGCLRLAGIGLRINIT